MRNPYEKNVFLLVASAFVIASVIIVCNAAGFSDVPENSWYKQYVDYTVSKELMNGVSDDEFAPNSNFTVAQCVTVAARLTVK